MKNLIKNVLGNVAAAPFYIWANEDCDSKVDSFKQAKAIRLDLFNSGCDSVHIVDADGVEVVDAEIEAHEELVKHGYFAGPRRPDVKPDLHGAFMVCDNQDQDGYAIVGGEIADLILEARAHLLLSSSDLDAPPSDMTTKTNSFLEDAKVVVERGNPDIRRAERFTQNWGMVLTAKLDVPRGLSEAEAEKFVTEALNKAVANVPQLKFHVIIGEPDL